MSILTAEEISRRSFVRRIFAIGAGVAVGGGLIRQLAPALTGRARLLLAEQALAGGISTATFPDWSRPPVPGPPLSLEMIRRATKAIYEAPFDDRVYYMTDGGVWLWTGRRS